MITSTLREAMNRVDSHAINSFKRDMTELFMQRKLSKISELKSKNFDDKQIQKRIKVFEVLQNKFSHDNTLRVLLALTVRPDFIVSQYRSNAFFNEYAIEKVIDFVRAIVGLECYGNGSVKIDQYSESLLMTLRNVTNAGKSLFTKDCEALFSVEKQNSLREEIKIHAVPKRKRVSISTVSTQTSSTKTALKVMNVIDYDRNVHNAAIKLLPTRQAKEFYSCIIDNVVR